MTGQAIVIGGGIIGAGISLRLAQAGWQVTVISAGAPAATAASFGWINASFYLDADHHRMRAEGIAAWHRLAADLDTQVAWTGCLCWDMAADALEETYATLSGLGYPVERMSREAVAARVPALRAPPSDALFFPTEGAAPSADLPERLLAAAAAHGMRHLRNVTVTSIGPSPDGRRQVETDIGTFTADQIVIAAGTGVADLASTCGGHVPLVHRPAYILRTAPVAPMLPHILASPIGEIRQEPSGRLLMPTTVNHQGDTAEDVTHPPDVAAGAAMARLRGLLHGLDDVDWADVSYAERPVPQDGKPVLGFIADGIYVASLHSGITLGPIVAELVAAEISGQLGNAQAALLSPYRPERFAPDA